MRRFQNNPILEPVAMHSWESRRVFNAAAIALDKRVHILYRAMGNDGVSRLGYAATSDGYNINERLPLPVFEPANDAEESGCEDPRLTLFDDKLVMVYTALAEHDHQHVYQVSLTSIAVDDFLSKHWKWEVTRTLLFFLESLAASMLCFIVLSQTYVRLILRIFGGGMTSDLC